VHEAGKGRENERGGLLSPPGEFSPLANSREEKLELYEILGTFSNSQGNIKLISPKYNIRNEPNLKINNTNVEARIHIGPNFWIRTLIILFASTLNNIHIVIIVIHAKIILKV